MKTGILRDDVTVKEFQTVGMSQYTYMKQAGARMRINEYSYPESWYTDIKEDHKPCPRCGGKGIFFTLGDYHRVYCSACRIRTEDHYQVSRAWEDWDKDYDLTTAGE